MHLGFELARGFCYFCPVFIDFCPFFLLNILFCSEILLQVPSAAKNSSPNLGSRHSLGQSSHPTQVHQISISNLSSTLVVEPISMAGVVQQQSVFPNASCPVSDLTKVAPYQAPPLNSNAAATDSTTKEIVTVSASDNTNLFCKVCKVSCSGSFNYKQHVRGQKHKTKLKMQLRVGGNSSGTSHQPRCNLCQIWCTDENSLKLHFDGQKHRAKLKETELHQKGIVLHQQLWCELCQVPCSNEDSFRMHLRGKNHVARLYNTRRENHSATAS